MDADTPRRPVSWRVAAVVALLGIAATGGLAVVFRNSGSTTEGQDSATGRRLEARLVVELDDRALAEATATLRLTNTSDQPAWYRGNECEGPGDPAIGPEGMRPPPVNALEEGSIRDRLIAAGEATRRVSFGRADGTFCEASEGLVEVGPNETFSWEYRTFDVPVDRSSTVAAVVVIGEVTRTGRSVDRLRLVVPFSALTDAGGPTVDQAVDAFLADPTVAGMVASSGDDGVLTVVSREGRGWRMSLGSSAGDLSGEVQPDLLVTNVHLIPAPQLG
ncbi:MAG TPA: hypothetical protein VID94_11045 [Acidimicrobiales bacterium]|jgi:hypothetical protein